MTKAMMAILEAMFADEVNSAIEKRPWLPYQRGGKKVLGRLESEGYIQRCKETLRGFPPVTVDGYRLTMLGHATYCFSCTDTPNDIREGSGG